MTLSESTRPALGPDAKIDVGLIFRDTYGTFRGAPFRFVWIAVLPLVVSTIGTLPALFQDPRNTDVTISIVLGLVSLLATLLQYVFQVATQGASIHAGERLLAGSTFTVGEALRVGFRRFWPMLGLLILLGLIFFAGFLLLVIPAFIAGCILAAALQACVLERLGPIEAMQRSAFLTKGNRWRVLGAYFVTIAPILAAFAVVVALGFGVYAIYQASGLSPSTIALGAVASLLLLVSTFVGIGIGGPFLATLFVELRRAKEGIEPQGPVAGVFD